MSPEREIRPSAKGTDKVLAGSSNTSSIPDAPDARHALRELIGCTVEKPLEAALWRLRLGEIGLEDLTPGLRGFCTLSFDDGYAAGIAFSEVELRQARADVGRYYSALFNPRVPIKVGPSYLELEKRRHTFAGVTE